MEAVYHGTIEVGGMYNICFMCYSLRGLTGKAMNMEPEMMMIIPAVAAVILAAIVLRCMGWHFGRKCPHCGSRMTSSVVGYADLGRCTEGVKVCDIECHSCGQQSRQLAR